MALSGTADLGYTADDIITYAYELSGVLSAAQAVTGPSTPQKASALRALEMMIKAYSNEGNTIWTRRDVTLFLNINENYYDLGPTGDHATLSPVVTELSADADSGDSTIDVDSITGISTADHIAIESDDEAIQWTTVNGAPAVLTITLTDVLTADADENNKVYAYTDILPYKPIKIEDAQYKDGNDRDHPVRVITKEDYNEIYYKGSSSDDLNTGDITKVYYDKRHTDGRLWVSRQPNDVSSRLILTCQIPIQTVSATTNDVDFPQEMYEMLSSNLGFRLCIMNERPVPPDLRSLAAYSLKMAKGSDRDAPLEISA